MSATTEKLTKRDVELPTGKFRAAALSEVDTLGLSASELLARGDGDAAFMLADRRCRLMVPGARDLFLRAQAHRAAGRQDAAQRDLNAALALDPTDVALDAAALSWGDAAARMEAAGRIVARGESSWKLRRLAVTALFASGRRMAHWLAQDRHKVSGWIAWAGGGPLRIEMNGADTQTFDLDPDPDHPLATAEIAAADVAIETAGSDCLTLTLRDAEGACETIAPARALRPRPQPAEPRSARQGADAPPFVTIVVPVYEDYEATRLCLESLAAARPVLPHRILAVDDASPNATLRSWLEEAAAAGAFELIRNERNLGFAAAVNEALAQREFGDALLLNADTVLAPGSIDRLRLLSRSSAGIGSVTPLSNNGELTSYPLRNEANPMPSPAEIVALDSLARRVNGEALVDIPNGVGFCLYITEACLDAVGALPELYAQGYYEDVEFCLTARERGFRNVAAPGVFVGHSGSLSFATRKRALVMRNLQLIEARFPGYRLETAAFIALDPLKPYRAALDAALPPSGPTILVACGPRAAATGRRRARELQPKNLEATIIVMVADARGRVTLSAAGGGAPQSLAFDVEGDGAEAFAAYLDKLDVVKVEWFDPASLPEAALSALIRLGVEIDLMCGDLSWFAEPPTPPQGPCAAPGSTLPCETCRDLAATRDDDEPHRLRRLKLGRALERADRIVPLDRLAESFALRVFKARAVKSDDAAQLEPRARSGPMARLGALYPHRTAAGDRLLLRLGRRLSGGAADLVVFGASLDDDALMATGSIFVTGPVAPEDYVELARAYRVEGLLAPDRGGGYGDLEAAATALALPRAYFDWSFGAFPVEGGDLSLDPRICDDKGAALIAAWMNGELQN